MIGYLFFSFKTIHGRRAISEPTVCKVLVSKAFSLLILLIMVVQVIYPLGLPGLKRRRDFWKLALVALGMMMLTVLIRP